MKSKYDFAYSVGLIRALELQLLNKNGVERMTLAKDPKEAFKVFNELTYADNKAGIEDPADFQEVIDEGLMDVKKLLDKVTPDKRVLNIVWHQFDFHNMKTLYKARLSGKEFTEVEHLISPYGAISVESLRSVIFDGKDVPFGLNPRTEQYLKKRLAQVEKYFHQEHDNPQVIDLFLDQKMMNIIYGIAVDSKSTFLLKYIQAYIDLANIKLFFRMKSQKKDVSLYNIAFLWYGTIKEHKFNEAYKEDLSRFPDIFRSTQYAKIIEEGYKHYEEEKTFIFLENEVENYLTILLRESKLIPFGPEPLIAYFLAIKNNALIIRMIMIYKLNNLGPTQIKRRLRKVHI